MDNNSVFNHRVAKSWDAGYDGHVKYQRVRNRTSPSKSLEEFQLQTSSKEFTKPHLSIRIETPENESIITTLTIAASPTENASAALLQRRITCYSPPASKSISSFGFEESSEDEFTPLLQMQRKVNGSINLLPPTPTKSPKKSPSNQSHTSKTSSSPKSGSASVLETPISKASSGVSSPRASISKIGASPRISLSKLSIGSSDLSSEAATPQLGTPTSKTKKRTPRHQKKKSSNVQFFFKKDNQKIKRLKERQVKQSKDKNEFELNCNRFIDIGKCIGSHRINTARGSNQPEIDFTREMEIELLSFNMSAEKFREQLISSNQSTREMIESVLKENGSNLLKEDIDHLNMIEAKWHNEDLKGDKGSQFIDEVISYLLKRQTEILGQSINEIVLDGKRKNLTATEILKVLVNKVEIGLNTVKYYHAVENNKTQAAIILDNLLKTSIAVCQDKEQQSTLEFIQLLNRCNKPNSYVEWKKSIQKFLKDKNPKQVINLLLREENNDHWKRFRNCLVEHNSNRWVGKDFLKEAISLFIEDFIIDSKMGSKTTLQSLIEVKTIKHMKLLKLIEENEGKVNLHPYKEQAVKENDVLLQLIKVYDTVEPNYKLKMKLEELGNLRSMEQLPVFKEDGSNTISVLRRLIQKSEAFEESYDLLIDRYQTEIKNGGPIYDLKVIKKWQDEGQKPPLKLLNKTIHDLLKILEEQWFREKELLLLYSKVLGNEMTARMEAGMKTYQEQKEFQYLHKAAAEIKNRVDKISNFRQLRDQTLKISKSVKNSEEALISNQEKIEENQKKINNICEKDKFKSKLIFTKKAKELKKLRKVNEEMKRIVSQTVEPGLIYFKNKFSTNIEALKKFQNQYKDEGIKFEKEYGDYIENLFNAQLDSGVLSEEDVSLFRLQHPATCASYNDEIAKRQHVKASSDFELRNLNEQLSLLKQLMS